MVARHKLFRATYMTLTFIDCHDLLSVSVFRRFQFHSCESESEFNGQVCHYHKQWDNLVWRSNFFVWFSWSVGSVWMHCGYNPINSQCIMINLSPNPSVHNLNRRKLNKAFNKKYQYLQRCASFLTDMHRCFCLGKM